MLRIKRLIHEGHRRPIWQVLIVYLGASYAIVEALDIFTDRWGLPSWLLPGTVLLLLVGLLVVLTAAIVPDTVEETWSADGVTAGPPPARRRRRTVRILLGLMPNPLPAEVLFTLERARVNERLGNRQQAVRAYAYVARA